MTAFWQNASRFWRREPLLSLAIGGGVLASLFGRGGRFFLVAGLLRWGGEPMERKLRQHVDLIGWISIALLVLLFVLLRLRS